MGESKFSEYHHRPVITHMDTVASDNTNGVTSYVNIGRKERHLAMRDLIGNDLLPTDDVRWDQGVRKTRDAGELSTNQTPRTLHLRNP